MSLNFEPRILFSDLSHIIILLDYLCLDLPLMSRSFLQQTLTGKNGIADFVDGRLSTMLLVCLPTQRNVRRLLKQLVVLALL